MNLNSPIEFRYPKPSKEFLDSLRKEDNCIEVKEERGILLARSYHQQGIRGATEKVYLRARLLKGLKDALKLLPKGNGFVVFDAYRSKATQAGLFEAYSRQIAAKYPDWSADQLYAETRKFIADPDEPGRFGVPPHNSGGAVDLGLTLHDQPVDMGTSFDDLTHRAATDFFDKPFDATLGFGQSQWLEIQKNRRMLFHSMREVGFTNWKYEWWHFDMGNSVWSQELGISSIYDSMIP